MAAEQQITEEQLTALGSEIAALKDNPDVFEWCCLKCGTTSEVTKMSVEVACCDKPVLGKVFVGAHSQDGDAWAAAGVLLELVERCAPAIAELQELSRTTMVEYRMENGDTEATYKAPASLGSLVKDFHDWFKDSGAENNITARMTVEFDSYSITVQKAGMLTPAQQRDAYRAMLDAAQNQCASAERELNEIGKILSDLVAANDADDLAAFDRVIVQARAYVKSEACNV